MRDRGLSGNAPMRDRGLSGSDTIGLKVGTEFHTCPEASRDFLTSGVCLLLSTRLRSIPRTALADTAADRKRRLIIVVLAAGRYWPGPKVCGGTHIYAPTVNLFSGRPLKAGQCLLWFGPPATRSGASSRCAAPSEVGWYFELSAAWLEMLLVCLESASSL
jgi:hypothetical protein